MDRHPAVAEQLAQSGMDPIELAVVRAYRVLVSIFADPEQVRDFADDDVRDAEATGNPHQLAFAYLGRLAIAAAKRDKESAVESFTQACRWAEIASNRRVLDNAPLWLAMAFYEDEPLEALSLVRGVLAAFYDAGYWGILDFALNDTLLPFVQLGHYRAAALAVGGLASPPDTSNPGDAAARAIAALADALGQDLQGFVNEGRALTRPALARLLLDEIDTCLQSH